MRGKSSLYLCECDCGTVKEVAAGNLKNGHTRSCGCLNRESIATRRRKHGESHSSREYVTWLQMKARCTNPASTSYERYGARGIKVCDRWAHSYENFLADVGRKPSPRHSIERIDNNGNYEPSNCRWATPKEQGMNKRPYRRFISLERKREIGRMAAAVRWNKYNVKGA